MSVSASFKLPSQDTLVANLQLFASTSDPISRILSASKTGIFIHPDGRTDDLGKVRLSQPQAGLLYHLASLCPKPLSFEVGFGMGSTAGVITASRAAAGQPFEHIAFDPYGLPDGRGKVVASYLEQVFSGHFKLIKKRSEVGLATMLDKHGPHCAGFIHIDGSHHYENIMADFVLAELLCCNGGYIVFDDAMFPAIETVLNYIASNRPDFELSHLPVHNTSVLKRIGPDLRGWSDFKPFLVPQRSDWEPRASK
jgi:hypothetical protein